MARLTKSFVVFCLVMGFVLSLPIPDVEESTETEVADDATDEPAKEVDNTTEESGDEEANGYQSDAPETTEGEGSDKETASKGSTGKDDRLNTYNKVSELLDKDTNVNQIENDFLRTFLNNNLHAHMRVPIIDAIGYIGDYSKIAECFASMGADVKKIIDEKVKTFTTCKSGKDSTDSKCSEDTSTGGQFEQITTKIKECVSAKGKGSK